MATSGTLTACWSNSYPTAAWVFSWTSKITSPGVTTVSWTLKTQGRTSSPTWLETKCLVTRDGSTVLSNKWNKDNSGAENSFNPASDYANRDSGSFSVQHNDNGAGSFTITLAGRTYETSGGSTSKTFSLDTNFPYTNCGAPTSVIIKESIQAPSKNIKIEWSGDKGGTSNPVASYLVSYKIGTGDWSDSIPATSSPKSITLPAGAERGAYVQVRVKTIGSVFGYDSGWTSSTASCKVNVLPGKPTVTVTGAGKNIPSNSSSTITATAGSSGDTGQSASVEYKIGTGSWTTYPGPISAGKDKKIGSNCTVYFRTKDGLGEYSEEVSVTFKINTTSPDFTSGNPAIITSNGNTKVQISVGGTGGQGTYTYGCYMIDEGGTRYWLGSASSNSFTMEDLRSKKAVTTKGYKYQIAVSISDGIETIWYNSSSYEIKGTKYNLMIKNDKTTTDEIEINPNVETTKYFFRYIRLKPNGLNTSEHPQIEILIKNGKDQIVFQETKGWNADGVAFDLNDLARDARYTLYFRARSAYYAPAFSSNKLKLFRVALHSLDNITSSFTINPYTTSGDEITFRNFAKEASPETLERYGFKSTSPTIKLTYNKASVNSAILFSTADTCKVALNQTNALTLFSSISQTKTTATSATVTYTLTNDYGYSVSGTSVIKVLYVDGTTKPKDTDSFSEIPSKILHVITPKSSADSENWASRVIEGSLVKVRCTYKGYHPIRKIVISGLNGAISKTETVTSDEVSSTQKEYSENVDLKIGKIKSDADNLELTITMYNSAGQSFSKTLSYKGNDDKKIPVCRLSEGRAVISKGEWTEENNNQKLTVHFVCSDFGYTTDIDYDNFLVQAYYKNQSGSYTLLQSSGGTGTVINVSNPEDYRSKVFDLTSEPDEFPSSPKTSGFITIKFKCTGSISGTTSYDSSHAASCSWWTNELLVYKASPTLSYRKNKVGVNYSFPQDGLEKPAFVVGEHSEASVVYFKGANHTIKIDIATAKIEGAIINCGSWDNSSSGNIPNKNPGGSVPDENVPTGLADIAYTGEISDLLQQDKTYEIIFNANQ